MKLMITADQAQALSDQFGGAFGEEVTIRRLEFFEPHPEIGVNIDGRTVRYNYSESDPEGRVVVEILEHIIEIVTKKPSNGGGSEARAPAAATVTPRSEPEPPHRTRGGRKRAE